MNYNFTLDNLVILEFFEGSASPPISELLYVHERPLLRPNFLTQIDDMVNEASILLEKKGVSKNGSTHRKLADIAIKLGSQLPNLTRTNATVVLETLKDLYILCKKIKGN